MENNTKIQQIIKKLDEKSRVSIWEVMRNYRDLKEYINKSGKFNHLNQRIDLLYDLAKESL